MKKNFKLMDMFPPEPKRKILSCGVTDRKISKPSLTRLARKAGIKSLSDDCFPFLNLLIRSRIESILKISRVLTDQREGKIILEKDCYDAVSILGEEMGKSEHLGTRVVPTIKK